MIATARQLCPVGMTWGMLLAGLLAVLATGPDTHAAPVVIEGQALNDRGGGILGAEVRVLTAEKDPKKAKLLVKGETNESGDFKLTLPAGTKGKILVVIKSEGFREFQETVDLEEDDEPWVVAELGGSLTLSGQVTHGRSDKPITGASVSYGTVVGSRSTKTDKDGRYKLAKLQKGPGRLSFAAEGFAREQIKLDLMESEKHDVELLPEYEVEIVVVDDHGKPVPGATVEALSDEPVRSFSAITDEKGRARIRGVHPDTLQLRFRLSTEDHITPRDWGRMLTLPEKSEKVSKKFVLPRPATLAGRVVAARGNKPVPLAHVSIGSDKRDFLTSTTTDAKGRFEIPGLPPDQIILTSQHKDFAPELRTVRLEPNKKTELTLKLPPGAVLRGQVKDASGNPVTQADVSGAGWRKHDTYMLHVRTDEKGEFMIEHAPRDGLELVVALKGQRLTVTDTLKPERKKHAIVIDASPSPSGTEPQIADVKEIAGLAKLVALDGKPLGKKRVEGKFVLLDFWATWCPPCRGEIPHLKAAVKALADRKDFVVIGVSLDEDEAVLRKFVKDQGITWPQLFGTAGGARQLAPAFGVRTIPSTFLLDASSRIVARNLRGPDLAKQLTKSMDAAAKAPKTKIDRPPN